MRAAVLLALLSSAHALCAAPSEPGCATCCRPGRPGVCNSYTSSTGSTGLVYNMWTRIDAPCSQACAPCASCFHSEVKQYQRSASRALERGCACDSEEESVDPCFVPDSCACACATLRSLEPRCASLGS